MFYYNLQGATIQGKLTSVNSLNSLASPSSVLSSHTRLATSPRFASVINILHHLLSQTRELMTSSRPIDRRDLCTYIVSRYPVLCHGMINTCTGQ